MKAAFFPESWRNNPYLDLLERSLGNQGVEFERVGSDYLSGRWLINHRRKVNVLHFHWIHYQYRKAPCIGSWRALAKFIAQVILARVLGYRIVWTMHNVLPHDRAPGSIDVVARKAMLILAHSVLVLCEEGRRQLAERFGRRKGVYVTPHGSYIGVYPDEVSRAQVRAKLDLEPEDTVFLFFGAVRPYKNVEMLLQTFRALPGENQKLFIVGAAHGEDIRQRVTQLAAADPRVTVVFGFVPDDQVRYYLKAADIVVFPFVRILSSSSAILAMSCGCPVVAPAMGCLPEWVTAECGILYDPVDPGALRMAMLDCCDRDLAAMGRAASERALAFSWEQAAKSTVAGYRGE